MQSTGRIGTRADYPSLEEAIAAHLKGEATVNDVATAFYEDRRVTKLTRHVCYKYGQPADYSDELLQELAVLLTQKFVSTTVDPSRIYNVLHATACNIARRKVAKASEASIGSYLGEDGEIIALAQVSQEYSELSYQGVAEFEQRLDHDKLAQEVVRRHDLQMKKEPSMLSFSPRLDVVDQTPSVVTRIVRKRVRLHAPNPKLSAHAIELADIRERLGYTVPKFAEALTVNRGTLASYLYGIVATVPDRVMKEARLLAKQQGPRREELLAQFSQLTMGEIADEWLTLMGWPTGDPNSDNALAQLLEVDRATVWRWRERNSRPDLNKLKEYDKFVRVRASPKKPKGRKVSA